MSEAIGKRPVATGRLSVGTKLGFGVCDLGGNLFFTALGFYAMIYLTDTVGIPAVVAGAVIMIGKLCDALWDPFLGYLSDRTRTKWGRRRPYMLLGSVPLFLAMWFFFTNPRIADPKLLVAWGAFAFILLNMIYSVVNIPYSSLTPELTKDYNERSSLNGYRFMFAVVGTLLGGVAVQPILGAFGGANGGDKSRGFSMVGFLFGGIMLVTAIITALSVREPDHSKEPKPEGGILATYASVFKNKPYVLALFAYACNLIGLAFLQGVITYYFRYIYGREDLIMYAMAILLVTAMICIPISVLVSKRIGKKMTYQICFFVLATASLVLFFFGQSLGPRFFLGMMLYAGIGVGFGYVAPYSMVPDTIEYDAVKSGKRKEGAFYGMWLLTSKIGQAIAFLATGLVLSLGGFVANAVQTDSAKLAIRFLIGPIPAVFLVLAMVLIHLYPLDEKSYLAFMEKETGPTGR
ncbi:MAG: MFS transporter [Rectinemataceae bacterium]|jgi:GPH family glycoside/pentoside/hexuronide:cation symporter